MPTIRIMWEPGADQSLPLPAYESAGAAGADLRANLPEAQRPGGLFIAPGMRVLVPTGLRVALPEGYEWQIRPRSGLAWRHAITVLNAPGTIDADYRGPVGVMLVNLGDTDFTVAHGARIAQAVLAPVSRADFKVTARLDTTARGAGGFGSTGQD